MGERSSFLTSPVTATEVSCGQVVGLGEDLGRDVALEDHALDDAGAVAELEEVELARGARGCRASRGG